MSVSLTFKCPTENNEGRIPDYYHPWIISINGAVDSIWISWNEDDQFWSPIDEGSPAQTVSMTSFYLQSSSEITITSYQYFFYDAVAMMLRALGINPMDVSEVVFFY